MTFMPHLASMEWDYADRLKHTLKSNGSAQDTYFTYDSSGQRVRKVYAHNGILEERIYLGGYEIFRRHTSGSISATPEEERQTLHLADDQRRIAMVETKTRDAGAAVSSPVSRWRFQLDNHLGSATLEVDQAGNVISYEEFHSYGSTAFHTADGNAEVSAKRYRYTGKEKDDETGLYYHGARYYAPWLGRWTAADPAGMADGLNLYRYSRDNPIVFADPGGTESKKPFAPVGSADWQVGTRTDAQLFRFLKAMTPEQRGALRGSSTGAFQARVDAFNQKYKLSTGPSAPESSASAEQAPSSSDVDFRYFYAVPDANGNPIRKPLSELSDEAIEELARSEALQGQLERQQEVLQAAERYETIKAHALLATAESLPVVGLPITAAHVADSEATTTSRVLAGVALAVGLLGLFGGLARSGGGAVDDLAREGEAATKLLKPVGGKINVGGGLEAGSEAATNLNPIVPGTGGPTTGIRNHVAAGFEDIATTFEPGSANYIFSNRLPFSTVDWTRAAQGAYKVLAPGGRLSLNVWTNSAAEAEAVAKAFQAAGFKNVSTYGSGPGTMIMGVR